MESCLVLEGGAMRGMYTAGVLDVLMDNSIRMDSVVGVSAGALFGVNYLSGQRGRAIRYNKRYGSDPRYMGIGPLLKEGNIVSTDFAYHEVPVNLDPFDAEAFRDSGVPFYAVCTNVETGEPEYFQIHDVFGQMDTLRASGSMPMLSHPVDIDGQPYLDGGISDSIPFQWPASQGAHKIVVILTRDKSYRKEPMNHTLVKLYGRKYPKLAERLEQRHTQYNQSVEMLHQWEDEGRAFVIRPSAPIEIGRIEKDPDKLETVYQLGLADGRAKLQALMDYLGQK